MRFNWRLASIALTLLPLVAATGCTGDKVIQPGNGRLELQLVVDPAVGPRADSKPPFNYAKLDLSAVTFKASDPLALIVFGPYPLQILLQPTLAEMVSSGAQSLGTIDISAGSYVMDKVFINGFNLNASVYCSVTTITECRTDADCPMLHCSNDGTKVCTQNSDCGPTCQNSFCSDDVTKACLQDSDCGPTCQNSPETCSTKLAPIQNVPRCSEGVLMSANFAVAGGSQEKGVVPTNQPVFEIRAGEVTVLRVVLDGATLTPLLEQNATCSTTTNGATLVSIPATSLGPMLSVQLP
jgi:hypothetical protein